MKPSEKSDDVPAEASDGTKTRMIERLDKGIKYYASKMHIVLTVIGTVFGIVEVVYGARYNGQCPIQQMIAIFLIVHGSVMLLEVAVGILAIVVARVIYPRNQTLARRIVFAIFLFFILVNLFCFAWFIAGNVWVFGAATNGYQSTDSTNMSTYCQMDLFRAAFGIIISRYIIVTIIIIVLIRYTIIRLCKGEKAPPPANDVDKMRI